MGKQNSRKTATGWKSGMGTTNGKSLLSQYTSDVFQQNASL